MGIPQKGDGLFKYGHEQITPDSHLHGGLSDYCLLRKHTPVIKIVKPLPLPVIAIINCAVATVAGSLRLAGPLTGRTVLVTGAGMLGIIACAMAKAGGAAKVIAVDIDDDRLAATRAFGADATVRIQPAGPSIKQALEQTMGKVSIDVALDYSGVPETMEASLEVLGIGGTAVWVGATFPQRPLQISAEKAVRNIHTIKGLHNYNEADLIAAVEFIENHCETYPFASLVHDKFTLDQVDAAFAYALSSGAHRVGIRLT
jgi:threonine dehydrogenase-like Zn-dependent dehydrogenase